MKTYLIEGVAIKTEKETVTVGFWKWKQTKEIERSIPLWEAKIIATNAQDFANKVCKLDKRISSAKITSITEIIK